MPDIKPQQRVANVLDTLSLWRRRFVERRAIAVLDERLLRDIGMAREVAEREAAKPFWEAGAVSRCPRA
ncbi:MAG: DUF1127 domain-containing protein [Dongiaceae bacterium]